MIAYLFWHCAYPTTTVEQYEEALFDHLVGAAKQRERYVKAKGLGRFQIDDQLDLGSLLNWKISRLLEKRAAH
jgi:hypothetical protein